MAPRRRASTVPTPPEHASAPPSPPRGRRSRRPTITGLRSLAISPASSSDALDGMFHSARVVGMPGPPFAPAVPYRSPNLTTNTNTNPSTNTNPNTSTNVASGPTGGTGMHLTPTPNSTAVATIIPPPGTNPAASTAGPTPGLVPKHFHVRAPIDDSSDDGLGLGITNGRRKQRKWSADELERLYRTVKVTRRDVHWAHVGDRVGDRGAGECLSKWRDLETRVVQCIRSLGDSDEPDREYEDVGYTDEPLGDDEWEVDDLGSDFGAEASSDEGEDPRKWGQLATHVRGVGEGVIPGVIGGAGVKSGVGVSQSVSVSEESGVVVSKEAGGDGGQTKTLY